MMPNLLDTFSTPEEWAKHEAYVNERSAEDERRREEIARMQALGDEYAQKTFRTFDTCGQPKLRDALRICKQFCVNVNDGQFAVLVLYGANGTGKTHLLRSITNELGGIFTDEFRLVDEYQQTRAFDSNETEERYIKRICSYKMRCIDEIGRSERVALSREVLFRIVDECVNMKKPLAIASNLQREQFLEHIGSAVLSRLNGCAVSVNMFGVEDYRKRSRDA